MSATAPQSWMEALSGDLKLTHIIGLVTGVAVIALGLLFVQQVNAFAPSASVTPTVVVAFIGGEVAILVVGLGANAAIAGAYLNAAASLSGVTVTGGPTTPAPTQQTPQALGVGAGIPQVATQEDIAKLTASVQSLQTAVSALQKTP